MGLDAYDNAKARWKHLREYPDCVADDVKSVLPILAKQGILSIEVRLLLLAVFSRITKFTFNPGRCELFLVSGPEYGNTRAVCLKLDDNAKRHIYTAPPSSSQLLFTLWRGPSQQSVFKVDSIHICRRPSHQWRLLDFFITSLLRHILGYCVRPTYCAIN